MNLNGQSKTSDSTTVSTPALKRVLIAAQQKQVLDSQISILNERISGYEGVIEALQDRDSATVKGYEKEISIMKDQRGVFEKEIKRLNRQIWWQNLKLAVVSTAAIVMGILYLTK